jgi:phage shock protein A
MPHPHPETISKTAGRLVSELVLKMATRIQDMEKVVDSIELQLSEVETLSAANENQLHELGNLEARIAELWNEISQIGLIAAAAKESAAQAVELTKSSLDE